MSKLAGIVGAIAILVIGGGKSSMADSNEEAPSFDNAVKTWSDRGGVAGKDFAVLSDAERVEARGESYELTPEQCNELQQEGIQYYHRYLSLFQINDFPGVIRDTQRNLDLFAFVAEHADRDELIWSFQQFRPYVLMMNTRAKASILLGEGRFGDAMREIERGRDAIQEFFQQSSFPELATKSSELAFLEEWLEEVSSKRPLSKLEIMQREMEIAIANELYERAAELRDAIKLPAADYSVDARLRELEDRSAFLARHIVQLP
jgi:hypothetical protein